MAKNIIVRRNKNGGICEEKDARITELRAELQANKDADTLLCDENRRLLESLTAKDAEIAKLRQLPSNVHTEEAPLEEQPAENAPCEEVDHEHFCKDCRHANETGSSSFYCCLACLRQFQ